MLIDLILKNRSYRRYKQIEISKDLLKSLINYARLSPSARNDQPLKYLLVNDQNDCSFITKNTSWASYLKDWDGPSEDEKPTAYILQFLDTNISSNCLCDHGIAAQSILLGAVEMNMGGCILASVNKKSIHKYFNINENLQLIQAIAIGFPSETIQISDIENNNTKYYRNNLDEHIVPKRKLKEIIIEE